MHFYVGVIKVVFGFFDAAGLDKVVLVAAGLVPVGYALGAVVVVVAAGFVGDVDDTAGLVAG